MAAELSDPAGDLRQRIELAKSGDDPASRDAALAALEPEASEQDNEDLTGLIRTYRGDCRLQLEGAS